jgi:hypothetical protein
MPSFFSAARLRLAAPAFAEVCMTARVRSLALLAPLALMAACQGSPRAEAAVAQPSSPASAPAPRSTSAPAKAAVARPVGAVSATGGKLPAADCDPAEKASASGRSSSTDPVGRLRNVMAGREHGALSGAEPIRCDPNEKKASAPRAGGS